MLVRSAKAGDRLTIDGPARVTVLELGRGLVRLAVEAEPEVGIRHQAGATPPRTHRRRRRR